MTSVIQIVDYANSQSDWAHRVAIAAVVRRDDQLELVALNQGQVAALDERANQHIGLVLRTLRNRIAHTGEATAPSAQVFIRDATPAEQASFGAQQR